jgi:large subunit ribosomal protein L18
MANKGIYTVRYRRKKQGLTNYKKRFAYIKSDKPRLVVRRFNKNIVAQVIRYAPAGDQVLLTVHTSDLKKYGWKFNTGNITSAYLLGYLLGSKSEEKDMILDIGLHSPIAGGRLFAVLKGAVDAGVNVPHSEDNIPPQDRIKGEHIAQYAKTLKKNKEAYERKFSEYIKNNVDPEKIVENFEETKSNITKKSG